MSNALHPSSVLDIPASGRPGSLLDGVDPRARVVAIVLFSFVVAAVGNLLTLSVALGLAVVGAVATGTGRRGNLKRLLPVNALVLILIVFLPLRGGIASLTTWGSFASAEDGLRLALAIALKANAIVLGVVVLLAGLDSVALGHALGHLGMPQKLTHLLLFTIRYLDVLHREYLRLRAAMKVRGFRPRVNWHTYRTIGYLVGMLLVRSLERSERIVAAMKCRGFRGRFYLLDHFAFSARDVGFSVVFLSAISLLAVLEWL
jgi:cobalt/nickel transport system permease protein